MNRSCFSLLPAILFVIYLLFFLSGCANDDGKINNESPAAPGTQNDPILNRTLPDTYTTSPHSILGSGLLYFDPDTELFEIVPSRESMLHVNTRRFMEDGVPCSDCFQIIGFNSNPDGTKDIDMQLRHPWPGMDDFTGFDMRLIIMWNGSETWPVSGLITQAPDSPDGYVFNADGYTTIFNPMDFPPGWNIPLFSYSVGKFATQKFPDSTLNPYIDYYSNEDRHMMGAGQADTRTWKMKFPDGPFVLGYAIDCSWEPPTVSPPVNLPDDFPIWANKPEAYRVNATQTDPLGDQPGDQAEVNVGASDWQGGFGNAWIECPKLWSGKLNPELSAMIPNNIIYTFIVTNETGVPEGSYRALVGVPDTSTVMPPWDYTTYIFLDIEVKAPIDPCCTMPPIAEFSYPEHAITGEEVTLTSQSIDPEGDECWCVVDWDLDGDGEYDDSSADTVNISWPEIGIYEIGLLATDSCGLTDTISHEIQVHVGVTKPEDQDYKTHNTRYSLTSAELEASTAIPFVDLSNPDGPWDFTGLPLTDIGNYRAVLAKDHPEVLPFAGNFTASFDHFYKTAGIYNIVEGAVYIAERYDIDPDRLMWVGLHEEEALGTFTFVPPMSQEFPFWIFSNESYSFGFPPLFDFNYEMEGWGEGEVTVPYAGVEDEPCVVVRYEISITSPDIFGSIMVYEWLIEDGTMVAIVGAINDEDETNYDEDTGIITGLATFNALNAIEPY